MRYEAPGSTIDVALSNAPTGLLGTLAVRLMKVVTGGADTTAIARTTAGIVENPAGSGIYQATVDLPDTAGDYYPLWDDGATFTRDDELIRVSLDRPTPPGFAGLTVEDLKRRIDRENVDDDLLAEFLQAAFLQAQAPPPFGCGRLLAPDPPSDGDAPVERELEVTGRTIFVPDAREITQVLGFSDAPLSAGLSYGNYKVIRQDGVIVALRLVTRERGDCRSAMDWRRDRNWPTSVKVTGRFGFATLPSNLAEAIYTLAGRMYFERDAQYSDQVRVAEGATGEAYFRQLPVRTKMVFSAFTVPAALAGLA